LDAYYAAFRIPDTLFTLLIVGALSAGFIPIFTELWRKDKQDAWAMANGVMNILGVLLIIASAGFFFLMPWLTDVMAPGFDEEKRALAVSLGRIMLLSPILLGISSVVGGVLQSMKSFFFYSLSPILYNIGIIIGAVLLVPVFGGAGLAYGVIIGAFLHLVIQLPAMRAYGWHYQWMLPWKHPGIRELSRLTVGRTLGLAAFQINAIAITVIASLLPAGSLAIFHFANNLGSVPVGIFGISFAIAAFPTLSEAATEATRETFIAHLIATIRQILFFILPVTILFLLLRAQIVRVVLGTGRFDWHATIATADTLAFFSLSLFAQWLIPLLARGFYALKDTWTPFLASAVSMIISVGASIIFKNMFGVVGLSMAFSLAMILQLSVLWIALRSRLGTLNESLLLPSLYKMTIAALAMSIVVQAAKTPLAAVVDMTKFWGVFVQGAAAGGIGILLYGGICYILRLEEMIHLKASMKRRWLKLWNVQEEIREEV
ncbi:MAG: murein biosynthesis integral membrane protein MurJ, partial [Patescibacteria group bacterium]